VADPSVPEAAIVSFPPPGPRRPSVTRKHEIRKILLRAGRHSSQSPPRAVWSAGGRLRPRNSGQIRVNPWKWAAFYACIKLLVAGVRDGSLCLEAEERGRRLCFRPRKISGSRFAALVNRNRRPASRPLVRRSIIASNPEGRAADECLSSDCSSAYRLHRSILDSTTQRSDP
jgi:hypothetical protein